MMQEDEVYGCLHDSLCYSLCHYGVLDLLFFSCLGISSYCSVGPCGGQDGRVQVWQILELHHHKVDHFQGGK